MKKDLEQIRIMMKKEHIKMLKFGEGISINIEKLLNILKKMSEEDIKKYNLEEYVN